MGCSGFYDKRDTFNRHIGKMFDFFFPASDTCMGVDCHQDAECNSFRGCVCKSGYQGDGTSCEGKQVGFYALAAGTFVVVVAAAGGAILLPSLLCFVLF